MSDKIKIDHTMLANKLMETQYFFSLDDTNEFYLYHNGCYTNEGTEIKMQKLAREAYHTLVEEIMKWDGVTQENCPALDARIQLIKETLAKLRDEHSMSRQELDKLQRVSMLVNFNNGILNLKTMEFMPPTPGMKLIRQIPVNYDPNAKCPKIEEFLNEVVSAEDKLLLEEIIGYYLIPDTKIQKAVMLYGQPGTGKSIFLQLLNIFIGDRNCSNVSLQQLEEDKYKVAELYGKLLNIYPDLREGILQHDNVFKTVVGGDKLLGERKYQNCFTFNNTARLIFSANEENLPMVRSGDKAFFRRWLLIRFPHVFYNSAEEDISIIEKLKTPAELSGLANLAIAGLKKVFKNKGFNYNKSVDDIEAEYRTYSSSAHAFVNNHLIPSDEDTKKLVLYDMYTVWCKSKELTVVSSNKFGGIVKKAGYSSYRAKNPDKDGNRPYSWSGLEVDDEINALYGEYLTANAKEPLKKATDNDEEVNNEEANNEFVHNSESTHNFENWWSSSPV